TEAEPGLVQPREGLEAGLGIGDADVQPARYLRDELLEALTRCRVRVVTKPGDDHRDRVVPLGARDRLQAADGRQHHRVDDDPARHRAYEIVQVSPAFRSSARSPSPRDSFAAAIWSATDPSYVGRSTLRKTPIGTAPIVCQVKRESANATDGSTRVASCTSSGPSSAATTSAEPSGARRTPLSPQRTSSPWRR